jgi:hypothetical protein
VNEIAETILAQEQAVIRRGLGSAKAVEGTLGIGEREGTLVLTNRRLIFACGAEKEEDIPVGTGYPRAIRLIFSEVEDLSSIPPDPENLFIPIPSIVSVEGHKGERLMNRLVVKWRDGEEKSSEFIQEITGKRSKNLSDWAPVIEKLKRGQQKMVPFPKVPGVETLEGKIMRVLGDMQEKGLITIEDQVEGELKVDLDPDQVEASCSNLVSQGLLVGRKDSTGDMFYRKRSPLGDDDLSA